MTPLQKRLLETALVTQLRSEQRGREVQPPVPPSDPPIVRPKRFWSSFVDNCNGPETRRTAFPKQGAWSEQFSVGPPVPTASYSGTAPGTHGPAPGVLFVSVSHSSAWAFAEGDPTVNNRRRPYPSPLPLPFPSVPAPSTRARAAGRGRPGRRPKRWRPARDCYSAHQRPATRGSLPSRRRLRYIE